MKTIAEVYHIAQEIKKLVEKYSLARDLVVLWNIKNEDLLQRRYNSIIDDWERMRRARTINVITSNALAFPVMFSMIGIGLLCTTEAVRHQAISWVLTALSLILFFVLQWAINRTENEKIAYVNNADPLWKFHKDVIDLFENFNPEKFKTRDQIRDHIRDLCAKQVSAEHLMKDSHLDSRHTLLLPSPVSDSSRVTIERFREHVRNLIRKASELHIVTWDLGVHYYDAEITWLREYGSKIPVDYSI
jgi:hypothetical protein